MRVSGGILFNSTCKNAGDVQKVYLIKTNSGLDLFKTIIFQVYFYSFFSIAQYDLIHLETL